MAANEQGRVDELLEWCEKEDIWIHPVLEIKSTSFEMGVGSSDNVIGQRWRDVCSGLMAKRVLTAPLVPYGDETEGSSDQDGSGSVIEAHGLSTKPACGQRRVPSGIGVYVRPNIPPGIIFGATMVRIPPSAVLSYKNAPAISPSCLGVRRIGESRHNDIPYVTIPIPLDQPEEDPEFTLAFALSVQMALGLASKWYGYLQSLPQDCVPLAIFWEESEEDWQLCRALIRGSTLDHYLRSQEVVQRMQALRLYWGDIVVGKWHLSPASSRRPPTWPAFRRVYSLVSSRAFHVDAYHGLAMVPIADAFNHTEENNVHLETDWQVCSECGSLDKCDHDAQDNTGKDLGGCKLEHSYDMVLNSPLPTGETGEGVEVFNTYDSGGIDNVHFLCRYGFTLEGNSRDIVLFDEEEVIQVGGVATAIDDAVGESGIGPSEMVNTAIHDLGIDAEGRISFRLWAAFVPAADRMRLAPTQCWVEMQSVVEHEEDGFQDIPSDTKPTQSDLLNIREATLKIIRLCDRRLERMWSPISEGDPTSSSSSSNAMLLGGSVQSGEESTALEMAWSYVLGERAIIEACRTVWSEFSLIVQDRRDPSREGE